MSATASSTSTHLEFPNGTEVINISPKSIFFGQRGVVYGSGPSRGNTSTSATIFVSWPSGEKHSYFPSRLAPAPSKEADYKVGNVSNRGGRKVTIHEIRVEKRARPTIFTRLSTKQSQ